jgi:hypothetical protein
LKQISRKGLAFFVLGIALGVIFRDGIGMIAGAVFFIIGVIFIIKNRPNQHKAPDK